VAENELKEKKKHSFVSVGDPSESRKKEDCQKGALEKKKRKFGAPTGTKESSKIRGASAISTIRQQDSQLERWV